MKVVHALNEISSSPRPCAVAIGNFDGLHLGHQEIISTMMKQAEELSVAPTVLTFYPHPVEVVRPGTNLERITTTSEKLSLLEAMGVKMTLVQKFDVELAEMKPHDFFHNFLCRDLGAVAITVGFDFSFGRNRAGNTDFLRALCAEKNIRLNIVEAVDREGVRVSSSLIRKLVKEGDVDSARKFLGRPYWLSGIVVVGRQVGRRMSFPTANIKVPEDKLLPAHGVYITRLTWQKQKYLSVTNIGVRPTLKGEETAITVETHVPDLNFNLYDEYLELDFLGRIRNEMKFNSMEDLKAQIEKDIREAKDRYPKLK